MSIANYQNNIENKNLEESTMTNDNIRTIDKLGRVIIPAGLRKELGWRTGDKIALCVNEDNGIIELIKLDKKAEEVAEE